MSPRGIRVRRRPRQRQGIYGEAIVTPELSALAARVLERDAENLTRFFGRFAPELRVTDYGKEIWALYESGQLHPEVELTGRFERIEPPPDVDGLLNEIEDVVKAEEARQRYKAMMEY